MHHQRVRVVNLPFAPCEAAGAGRFKPIFRADGVHSGTLTRPARRVGESTLRKVHTEQKQGGEPAQDKWAMATNLFIEFRLDEAQALADYTSIAFDLRTACDFAIAILEEIKNLRPIFRFAIRSWLQLLFGMPELSPGACD